MQRNSGQRSSESIQRKKGTWLGDKDMYLCDTLEIKGENHIEIQYIRREQMSGPLALDTTHWARGDEPHPWMELWAKEVVSSLCANPPVYMACLLIWQWCADHLLWESSTATLWTTTPRAQGSPVRLAGDSDTCRAKNKRYKLKDGDGVWFVSAWGWTPGCGWLVSPAFRSVARLTDSSF